MKTISFRQKSNPEDDNTIVILQPDFKIMNRDPEITVNNTNSVRVAIGCQSETFSKNSINILIDQIKIILGEKTEKVNMISVIVLKGKTGTNSSARFLSNAGKYYISKSKNAYEVSKYEVQKIKEKLKNPFTTRGDNFIYESLYNTHTISKEGLQNLLWILNKINDEIFTN